MSSEPRALPGTDVLAPRRLPTQARAKKTLEHLLQTAAELLDEVGVGAFNTNLLAERAGVRVRTVYRYFPNKLAVVATLASRLTEEWDHWFEGFALLSDPQNDWRMLWSTYVDSFFDGVRSLPGGIAVRRAMRALPELREIDQRDNERLARALSQALQRRGLKISPSRQHAMARMLIESAVVVIDLALLGETPSPQTLLKELKIMQIRYLESHLS